MSSGEIYHYDGDLLRRFYSRHVPYYYYVTPPVSTKIANSRNPFDALGDGELDFDVQVDEVKEPMDYDAVGTAKPMESTTDGMVIYGENGRKVTICWGKKFDYKWADEVDA